LVVFGEVFFKLSRDPHFCAEGSEELTPLSRRSVARQRRKPGLQIANGIAAFSKLPA
jgi:hypothetical protein